MADIDVVIRLQRALGGHELPQEVIDRLAWEMHALQRETVDAVADFLVLEAADSSTSREAAEVLRSHAVRIRRREWVR
jgi:hypothetical protein